MSCHFVCFCRAVHPRRSLCTPAGVFAPAINILDDQQGNTQRDEFNSSAVRLPHLLQRAKLHRNPPKFWCFLMLDKLRWLRVSLFFTLALIQSSGPIPSSFESHRSGRRAKAQIFLAKETRITISSVIQEILPKESCDIAQRVMAARFFFGPLFMQSQPRVTPLFTRCCDERMGWDVGCTSHIKSLINQRTRRGDWVLYVSIELGEY